MIKKIIIPILFMIFSWLSCADPDAGSGVPIFFRDVKAVSAASSGNHTVAIKTDSTLWAWGYNDYGQLGNFTYYWFEIPVQAKTELSTFFINIETISVGGDYTAAINSENKLYTWGKNNSGQLGDGTTTDKLSPAPVSTDKWIAVSTGWEHTIAIKKDGTIWAWGRNDYGQLGLGSLGGTHYTHEQVMIVGISGVANNDWIAVSSGGNHTIAIKKDGTIWAWGRNDYGQLGLGSLGGTHHTPEQVMIVGISGVVNNDWKEVSTGWEHTIAIKKDGTIWAWGSNGYGQLGDATTTQHTIPVQIKTEKWKVISAGYYHTAAIKNDGSLWTWGDNGYGQLGDGTTINKNSPVKIGDRWKTVSAGGAHTVAIKEDGVCWAWGNNGFGQLGDATTIDRLSPVRVILSGW